MSEPDINDSEIQKLLQRVREKSSQGEYIYRGESEQYDKISSTLYRRYAEKIDAEYFDIQTAQKQMLEQVKNTPILLMKPTCSPNCNISEAKPI